MMRTVVTLGSAAVLGLALVACGGGGGDDVSDGSDVTEPITGDSQHFVSNTISVPQSSADSNKYGLNLDSDPMDSPDNALGRILATLKAQNVDIQTQVTDSVKSGSLIILHSVQSDDATLASDQSVGWTVYLGNATETDPKYDGTDTFTVSADSPKDGLVKGKLNGGFFKGGPGNVTIQLSLSAGAPIKVKLIGTRIESTMSASGCVDGKLGGAITDEELHSSVIPGIVTLMNNSVKDDGANNMPIACTMANDTKCVASPSGDATSCDVARGHCYTSTSKTILDLFDTMPKDGDITQTEVENNSLIKALLAPDVDLLDESGAFNPRKDGTKDSLSLGLGFTCVKGVYTP